MACEEVGFDSRERFLASFSSMLTLHCGILTSREQSAFKSQLLNSYHQRAADWATALHVDRFVPNVATRKGRKNKTTRDSEGRDRHQADRHPSASSSSSLPQAVDVDRTSLGLHPRPVRDVSPLETVDPWQIIRLQQRRIQELESEVASLQDRLVSLRRHADFLAWRVRMGLAIGDDREIVRRSAFGFAGVYNMLPEEAVSKGNVSDFQRFLSDMVKDRFVAQERFWKSTLSTRCDVMTRRRLLQLHGR